MAAVTVAAPTTQVAREAAYTNIVGLKPSKLQKMGSHIDEETGEEAFGVKRGSRVYVFCHQQHHTVYSASPNVTALRGWLTAYKTQKSVTTVAKVDNILNELNNTDFTFADVVCAQLDARCNCCVALDFKPAGLGAGKRFPCVAASITAQVDFPDHANDEPAFRQESQIVSICYGCKAKGTSCDLSLAPSRVSGSKLKVKASAKKEYFKLANEAEKALKLLAPDLTGTSARANVKSIRGFIAKVRKDIEEAPKFR